MARPETLDCQDCGATLRELTPAEAQQVAQRPYDFILYCRECAKRVWAALAAADH